MKSFIKFLAFIFVLPFILLLLMMVVAIASTIVLAAV